MTTRVALIVIASRAYFLVRFQTWLCGAEIRSVHAQHAVRRFGREPCRPIGSTEVCYANGISTFSKLLRQLEQIEHAADAHIGFIGSTKFCAEDGGPFDGEV